MGKHGALIFLSGSLFGGRVNPACLFFLDVELAWRTCRKPHCRSRPKASRSKLQPAQSGKLIFFNIYNVFFTQSIVLLFDVFRNFATRISQLKQVYD